MTASAVVDQLPLVDALPVEHLFDMTVELLPAQPVPTTTGMRMTFVAAGGAIAGPALTGEVLPGGGDWLLVGEDGVGRVDVRVTLRSDDGVLIHFESAGIIKVPADGAQRLAAGEVLPFRETYVRTTPRLATADERYSRLGEVVTVAYNILSPNRVDYRVYQVL
ncbi:DUF3237 domain-containing protein [Mycobacterium neumannii]|uniref:DUF3237 domain-containing protein n=1 Tax=Mycobacterium neumannii TaxID=2048551 RepID=UPI003AB1DB16